MDASKQIDALVCEMSDAGIAARKIREDLHRYVDESCDQLNLDAVDAKYDATDA